MQKTHTLVARLCSLCGLIRRWRKHVIMIMLKLLVHGLKTSHVSPVPQDPNLGKYWPRAALGVQRLEYKLLPEVNEPVQEGGRI